MRAIIGLLVFALFGVLFVVGAIHSSRRLGRSGLAVAWLLGTIVLTAMAFMRSHQNRTAIAGGSGWGPDMASLPLFLTVAGCACGGATLVLLRRWRRAGALTRTDIGVGFGGFAAGAAVPLVVALGQDIAELFRSRS